MRTEQLIAELAASPAPAGNPRLRIVSAMFVGSLVAVVGLAVVEGPPLVAVAHTGVDPLAVKLAYGLTMAWLAVAAVTAAGRPGRTVADRMKLFVVPILLLLAVAAVELAMADRADWGAMVSGTHYWSCLVSVALASAPIFLGLIWAYRILAPTRLVLAGFLIGLSSGAAGASAFALYCHEAAAAFLVTAYTPAMLVPALVGALVARPLLRW